MPVALCIPVLPRQVSSFTTPPQLTHGRPDTSLPFFLRNLYQQNTAVRINTLPASGQSAQHFTRTPMCPARKRSRCLLRHPSIRLDLVPSGLGLHGNQLNCIATAWTCGYVLGQIPSKFVDYYKGSPLFLRSHTVVAFSSPGSDLRCESPPWNSFGVRLQWFSPL